LSLFNKTIQLCHVLKIQFGITDNNEKYYICNIRSNNNDEPIEIVILVSVSESVLFIVDISFIRISVNLFIGVPLIPMIVRSK